MSTVEIKYLCTPHDGTPGKPWEEFEGRLLDVASGKTDEHGWSLADCLNEVDEGSAGGPALPAGAAANAKAQQLLRKRLKDSYSLLVKHELDEAHKLHMQQTFFQQGPAAWQYMIAECREPVDRLQLRQMDAEWDDMDLLQDVGVSPNSIADMCKKIKAINAKRPAGQRKDQTQCGERLLELIFNCSKHFSNMALIEYNAPAAQWQFRHAGGPAIGQRDFAALAGHYQSLWKQAVNSKLAGFHTRAPAAKPAKPIRTTLEAGMAAVERGAGERAFSAAGSYPQSANEAGSADTFVARTISPSRTLALLADAGDDIAARHGTVTTTDFGMLTAEELCEVCGSGDELIHVFDDNDTASVEISCNNCGGLGHIARVCPSNKRQRTLAFIIATLQARLDKIGSAPPKRPPGRGQRAPFRAQPRRFQPARRSDGQRLSAPRPKRRIYLSREEGDYDSEGDGGDSAALAAEECAGAAAERPVPSADSTPQEPPVQRLEFSDDQLFQEERIRSAVELTLEKPSAKHVSLSISPIAILLAVATLVASAASVALAGVERLRALGGIAILVLLLTILGRTHGATVPTLTERLLAGREEGLISVGGGLLATVDSGATSTAIPESMGHMLKRVTVADPQQKIWIANDKGLDIVKIGEMDIEAPGYKLVPKKGVAPRFWKQENCTAILPSSRTLVVRGLGPNTVLYSVKGLKSDGINTFLNDDNSIGREDCLLLKDKLTVIPFANTYAYQIPIGTEHGHSASDVTSNRSSKMPLVFHSALGHVGNHRLKSSNIVMDGVKVSGLEHNHTTCLGCRLGNTGKSLTRHKRWKQAPSGSSRVGFQHFGQQVDTDICTGFKASFPHQFTSMINFNDRYTVEKWVYFMRHGESAEVCSSLDHWASSHETRLRDGKIGRWVTDNSKSFLSAQTEECAEDLVQNRGFSVFNDSDSLPVPERHWGVLQRMMRSMHAGAEAPECLWTWSAQQSSLLLYFLPTAAHEPYMSPYQFSTGDASPVDLSWARVMFCDVTVTLPQRDIHGKVSNHSADGCHLGYDRRRNAHFVYVESLQRLSSFTVTEWREDSFLACKRISADSPVEYFEAHDLPYSKVTGTLIAHRHTVRARRELGNQVRSGIRVLVLFHREREHSMIAFLRNMGHSVDSRDLVDGCDLRLAEKQYQVLDSIPSYDFVFACPPCTTASIAFDPPIRTYPDATRGVAGLTGKHQVLIDDHNNLFDFSAEVIHRCNASTVAWALESCASRRRRNAANWPRYHRNAFVWDYPPIERVFTTTTARTRCCAQCQFQSPWQKYTDIGTSEAANEPFDRIFLGADCHCDSHELVLQGYDAHGVARTAAAADYKPGFASAIAHGIDDTCRSSKEGEDWLLSVNSLNRTELNFQMASSALEPESPDAPVTHGLTRAEISHLHSRAHRERLDIEPDLEIFLDDSEGGYVSVTRLESALRVSEVGSELAAIKTVAQARASKHWPLFRDAMEEEIKGKMENSAWRVVARPTDRTVHNSRWVLAVKLNDDNSIKVIKARFVGCGYSQVKDRDFDSVFAATLPGVSFRLLVCWIADEDLDTDHIDAVKAFTQAGIDKEVYVQSPEGFTADDQPPSLSAFCLLLDMALEGIKQGANLWFGLNRAAWLKLGCKSWINETNLYHHSEMGLRVGVFADDTLAGYPRGKRAQYLRMKKEYSKIIKIGSEDEISPVIKFTGVQIHRDRMARTATIHQTRYIEQMVESLRQEGIKLKPYDTPHGNTKEERLAFDQILEDKDSPAISKITFLQLMGKLVWPSSMTRPDVSMQVSTLCSCVSNPRQVHYDYALIVAGYLMEHKQLGISYGGSLRVPYGLPKVPIGFNESHGLYTAHDSSWGTRPKPLGGYIVMYMNGGIDWSAKLVKIVPDSTCEAETAVGSKASKGTCFVRGLLSFHQRPVAAATPLIGDNEAMHTFVSNEGATARTRYYERATALMKRAVLMLLLHPLLVATHYMIADMFTKPLEKSTFVRFRNIIMNCNGHTRDLLSLAISSLHGQTRRMATRLLPQL